MRPTPTRDIVDAVVTTLQRPEAEIADQALSPIRFVAALSDEPHAVLLRAMHEDRAVFVRHEGSVRPGDSNCGEIAGWLTIGCYYYRKVGGDQREDELSAWDVLWRLAQAVGEELARPGGCTGDVALTPGRFGKGTGRNRIGDMNPLTEMRLGPLEPPNAEEGGANDSTLEGVYKFEIEYRMDLQGGTD